MSETPTALDHAANADKLQLRALLRKREKLNDENALLFYRPHAKQELFHAHGDVRWRFVRTGNRWGKSQCGAAEDVAWALGERPWYPTGDPRRTNGIPKRATKGCILVYDWSKAHEIFTCMDKGSRGKLFQWLPKHAFVGVEKGSSGDISSIKVRSVYGGISIIALQTVKSFMQNPMGHESSNWDWVHVDEPIPQDMWKAYARGLVDSSGSAWFLCTPLNEPWITDFFIPNRQTELNERHGSRFGNKYVIIGSSYDNPYVTEEALTEFEEMLTPEERECRLHGQQLSKGGLVYKNFDRLENVFSKPPIGWESMDRPPADYTIRYALDPHPRTPDAVLFAATAPSGEVFFYADYFQRSDPTVLADNILRNTEGLNVVSAICDPAGFIENPITGTTYADELAMLGVYFEKSSKDLARGIVETEAALGERMPAGHKRLQFSKNLGETLYEFDRYEWDAKRRDKPVDKDDHMMENLYRLVINGLEYVPPEKGGVRHFAQYDPVDESINFL